MKRLIFLQIVMTLLVGISAPHLAYARGYYYHGYGGPRVIIGAGPIWWPPAYYGPPPYYGPPATVYVSPPAPQVYVQQPAPASAYYCRSPGGYYPQVKRCPSGWLKVVAPAPAPY
ncbi:MULTISPECIES: hypothetical protein [unclassified Pantoea]|uniref:hypothetical protein n=1 Tax=unclassified Pantoea TaxID=2630326 RepID=UPI0028AC094C|nr:hypothetical protein [Pantoea sp.]